MVIHFAAAAVVTAIVLGAAAITEPASLRQIQREYSRHSVRAVPRDGFPALFDPPMSSAAEGDMFFRAGEWVIGVHLRGEAKAYPVTVMGIHELINDTVGGWPITVCW